jgi:AcrR family transcriptional regulator
MDKLVKSRRSGPRTFNRDEAIETAMRLFWRHGYEGVSVGDLTAAIGIAPPSLYSAFGNKAGLYREALDRYRSLPGALDGLSRAKSLEEAVEGLLRDAVVAATASSSELGCMVSSGMVECAVENEGVAQDLTERRRSIRDVIALTLERWVDGPTANALAGYFAAVMQGLSVQARDGASWDELERVVDQAIAGFRARGLGRDRQWMRRGGSERTAASANPTA